jgi:hypothetical protein
MGGSFHGELLNNHMVTTLVWEKIKPSGENQFAMKIMKI